jgi:hypothetical protein
VIEKLGELRDGKASSEKKTLAAVAEAGTAESSPRVAETTDANADVEEIWRRVYAKIPNTKAFVRNSAAAAHVLPSEGRYFVLGFSPDQRSTMDILATATNRKMIESLLHEVSGKDWTLKLAVQERLPKKTQSSSNSAPEDYADDPLIREALEIFQGEIRR